MPFGLTNAPFIFMNFMNNIFQPLLDTFVVALFINDILVFSKFDEAYRKHIKIVLDTLRSHKMYAKLIKVIFWVKEAML